MIKMAFSHPCLTRSLVRYPKNERGARSQGEPEDGGEGACRTSQEKHKRMSAVAALGGASHFREVHGRAIHASATK